MTEYVVEFYLSRVCPDRVAKAAERARAAAEDLFAEGVAVRYTGSIFVPEDETCLHVYEAETAESVREASRRAGTAVTRVVEAVGFRRETTPARTPAKRKERSRE